MIHILLLLLPFLFKHEKATVILLTIGEEVTVVSNDIKIIILCDTFVQIFENWSLYGFLKHEIITVSYCYQTLNFLKRHLL